MARREVFNKEQILEKCVLYVKEYGIHNLNARSISQYIGCSTQPIFRHYDNMSMFKKDLKKYILKDYHNFINKIIDKDDYLLTISYAYAMYAKEESNLFHALFISDLAGSRTVEEVINSNWNRDTINQMKIRYKISLNDAEILYRDVRFYTHGIATQLCCKSIILDEKEIYFLIRNMIEKIGG